MGCCKHDAVDESLIYQRSRRVWTPYFESCLDCGAARWRKIGRLFRGSWSPWLGVSDAD